MDDPNLVTTLGSQFRRICSWTTISFHPLRRRGDHLSRPGAKPRRESSRQLWLHYRFHEIRRRARQGKVSCFAHLSSCRCLISGVTATPSSLSFRLSTWEGNSNEEGPFQGSSYGGDENGDGGSVSFLIGEFLPFVSSTRPDSAYNNLTDELRYTRRAHEHASNMLRSFPSRKER